MEATVAPDIRIFPDPELLAEAAAGMLADSAASAISEKGCFALALSGGSTPRALFRVLGSAYQDKIKWSSVDLFWADERCVPRDHKESNYRLADEELISKVAMPSGNIHRIRGELNPPDAAAAYENDLRHYFGDCRMPIFDLIVLGIGQDGHTASLFPGTGGLNESARMAVPSYSRAAGNWRVTLTLPVLNNARNIFFLASGESKAGIISAILTKGMGQSCPAGLVNPLKGHLVWLLDKAASSRLQT